MNKTSIQRRLTRQVIVWAKEGRTGPTSTRTSAVKTKRKQGSKATRRTGSKPGPKPGKRAARRTGSKPGPKPGKRAARRTGSKPGPKPGKRAARRTGSKPGPKPGKRAARRTGSKPGPKPGKRAARRTGSKPGPKPGKRAARRTGSKPGPKPGKRAARRTGSKPGPKPGKRAARRTGSKPGRKPARKAASKRINESSKPLKMSEVVAYAAKATSIADKLGEPWKAVRKGGRPPYPPKILAVTRALKDKFGPRYAPNEKRMAGNKKLLAAMRTDALPSKDDHGGRAQKDPQQVLQETSRAGRIAGTPRGGRALARGSPLFCISIQD